MICIGCNSIQTKSISNNDVIDIDVASVLSGKGIALEDIVESIDKVISLQTTEEAMVGSWIDYLMTDDNIYITDLYQGGSVVIFDINGKFVSRINKGQGPGEINVAVCNIFYDYANNRLFVHDFAFLKEYTQDGQYIQTYLVDYQQIKGDIKAIQKIPEGFLAVTQDANFETSVVQFDTTMTMIWSTKMPNLPQEDTRRLIRGVGNNYWLTRTLDNNFYNCSGDSIQLVYHLDLKNFEHIVKEEYRGPDHASMFVKAMGNIESGKYIFMCCPFGESEDYISFRIWTSGSNINIFYNKKNGQLLKESKVMGSLFDIVSSNYRTLGKSNYFYSLINPERLLVGRAWNWNGVNPNNLLSDKDMATLKKTKPDDNPIIVIYKLKADIKK